MELYFTLPRGSVAQYVGMPFPFTYSLYLGKEILGCQMVSLFLMLKRSSKLARSGKPVCLRAS